MSVSKQELLEYIEIHAVIERHTKKFGDKTKEVINATVVYPEEGKFYTKAFSITDDLKKEKDIIKKAFELLVQEIIDKMNSIKKEEWTKEVIYKVCPQMLCGDNPCSCENEK